MTTGIQKSAHTYTYIYTYRDKYSHIHSIYKQQSYISYSHSKTLYTRGNLYILYSLKHTIYKRALYVSYSSETLLRKELVLTFEFRKQGTDICVSW